MYIIKYDDSHIEGIVKLWNNCVSEKGLIKGIHQSGFEDKFINNENFNKNGCYIAMDNDKVIGFIHGICKKAFLKNETSDTTPGYVTCILVAKDYRRKGIATQLLEKLEEFFRSENKNEIQVSFFNPVKLEWYIPGTSKHDHNNTPGVNINSSEYFFLLNRGFIHYGFMDSYYLPLEGYEIPSKILEQQRKNEKDDICVTLYDPEKHNGFDQLFDNLNNEDWRFHINSNLEKDKPYPIVIGEHKGKIIGFAGPLFVQESGRGYFAGIGVSDEYRGYGLGKIIFATLCSELKGMGAEFMSLFTGTNNPAKKIYIRAGFKVVQSWVTMKKELL